MVFEKTCINLKHNIIILHYVTVLHNVTLEIFKSSYVKKLREKIDKLVESKEEQNKQIAILKETIEKLKKENSELQNLPKLQVL